MKERPILLRRIISSSSLSDRYYFVKPFSLLIIIPRKFESNYSRVSENSVWVVGRKPLVCVYFILIWFDRGCLRVLYRVCGRLKQVRDPTTIARDTCRWRLKICHTLSELFVAYRGTLLLRYYRHVLLSFNHIVLLRCFCYARSSV